MCILVILNKSYSNLSNVTKTGQVLLIKYRRFHFSVNFRIVMQFSYLVGMNKLITL